MKKWITLFLIGVTGATVTMMANGSDSTQTARLALERGKAAVEQKDYDTALAEFERAKEDREVEPHAWLNIGAVKELNGEYEAAISAYAKAANTHYDPLPSFTAVFRLNHYGIEALNKKNYAEAEKLFRPGSRLNHSASYSGLAVALIEQGKWDEAAGAARELLGKHPMEVNGYGLLFHALTSQAEVAAQDPANHELAKTLLADAKEVEAKVQALPVLVEDLWRVEENGRTIVRASLTGHAAPAGHYCILGFKLWSDESPQAAATTFLAPAQGTKLTIDALAPQGMANLFDVSYHVAHCEAPGAATATPPDAENASVLSCPNDAEKAYELLDGRDPYGTLEMPYQQSFAYPGGGIRVFDKPITRFIAQADSRGNFIGVDFGLPGKLSDYERRFKEMHTVLTPECGDDYCRVTSQFDTLASEELIYQALPEGMHDKGLYLKCRYRNY